MVCGMPRTMPCANAKMRSCDGAPRQRSASATSASPSVRSKAVKWPRIAAASLSGSIVSSQTIGRLQHLQIAPRQQRARIGDGAGVAGKLHAVFGGAERGGADAFAGRQQRPGQRAGVEPLAQRVAEPAAHVAEVAVLAAVDVFADAARQHDAVDAAELGDRLGQIERRERRRQRPHADRGDQRVGHVFGDLVERGGLGAVALVPVKARLRGVVLAGRIEPDDAAVVVDHLQPAADVDGGGRDHAAVLDQRELGGAAADVDVEDALALVGGDARGARAVGRQHRLHVMAGGGADEVAALLGQQAGDRLRVVAPQRLAGQDHHAGVDVLGVERGLRDRRRR